MKPLSAVARKRARIQGATYLVGGFLVMAFLMLYLAPRAQAERALRRSMRGGKTTELTLAGAQPGTPAEAAALPPTEPTAPKAEPVAAEPSAAEPAEPVAAEPAEPVAAEPAEPAAAEPSAAAPAEPSAAAPAEPSPSQPPAEPATPSGRELPPLPKPLAVTRFSTASAELGAGQREQVARAAQVLKRDPSLRVTIRGHADQRGTEDRNEPLSEQRAKAVASALRALGIADERLQVLGAGSHQPLDPGSSLPAHARNRRVDLVFDRKETP